MKNQIQEEQSEESYEINNNINWYNFETLFLEAYKNKVIRKVTTNYSELKMVIAFNEPFYSRILNSKEQINLIDSLIGNLKLSLEDKFIVKTEHDCSMVYIMPTDSEEATLKLFAHELCDIIVHNISNYLCLNLFNQSNIMFEKISSIFDKNKEKIYPKKITNWDNQLYKIPKEFSTGNYKNYEKLNSLYNEMLEEYSNLTDNQLTPVSQTQIHSDKRQSNNDFILLPKKPPSFDDDQIEEEANDIISQKII